MSNNEHLNADINSLLALAEAQVGHADLGFSDMGEIEGRHEFYKFMQQKDKGYRLPFASLETKFLIAPHELTLLSGYTGLGKSELVNQILLDCIAQGAKGVITSLELTSNQLKKRLYQQATGLCTATENQVQQFHDFYAGKLKYWNGTKMQKISQLLNVMEKFYCEYGCTVFVLDNMMMLGARPTDYDKHYDTVNAVKEFCKCFPVSVFLVAHPRKPESNTWVDLKNPMPYQFDVPSIYDVSGSATIANLVDNFLSLGRNTVKFHTWAEIEAGRLERRSCEHILKHGDIILRRGKKREHGDMFNIELYFDVNYRRYKEAFTEKLMPYLYL